MASTYPTSNDLNTFLTQAKIQNAYLLPLDWAVEAARDDFETQVNYTVLATTGTRRFDPPRNASGKVDLREPCAAVTSVTMDNQPLTDGTDYWMHPYNAPEKGRPYRVIELYKSFPYMLPGVRRSLVITGKWGLSIEVPNDIFQAILCRASQTLVPTIQSALSRGLVSWSEAGVQENYGTEPLSFLADGWKAVFEDTVRRRMDHRAGV